MATMTPLLLLLKAILSHDAAVTAMALHQIRDLIDIGRLQESPLRSSIVLERIVQALLRHHPWLAQVATVDDCSLPLHLAASIGNTRVARLLIQYYRQGALTPNSKGKIPLHYAAREGRTDMVKHMLQVVPEAAAILSQKGKLALHFAACEGHVEVCRALLQVHPEGASIPSKKGKVAIHFAARWGHRIIAEDLHQLFPEGVSTLDYDGSLPLHDATREGQFEVAKYLVELYPEGLSKENLRGEIPLFKAVRSGRLDLCSFLIHAWPQGGKQVLRGVREEDGVQSWEPCMLDLCLRGAVNMLGQNPTCHPTTIEPVEDIFRLTATTGPTRGAAPFEFDHFFSRSISPELFEVSPRKKRPMSSDKLESDKRARIESLDTNPSNPETSPKIQQFLPLHAAIQCEASPPVLNYTMDLHSDNLKRKDDNDMLPLHLAIQHGSEDTLPFVLERLWKAYPEACFQRDHLGRLPLHLALKARSDCRLVRSLLDSNPSAIGEDYSIKDPDFSETRLVLMAAEFQCDLSTVFMLLREDPSVLKETILKG
eukprot:scaffold1727_cov133-Cylindrotheca_fusiformis.AAC.64